MLAKPPSKPHGPVVVVRAAHTLALIIAVLTFGCGARPAACPTTTTATPSAPMTKAIAVQERADGCLPPTENEPRVDFAPRPLIAICHGVYVDPAMPWEDRELVKTLYGEARLAVATFFGARVEAPSAIVCATDACADAFSGPTRRSRATMRPRPTVIVNGVGPLTKGTLVHEMIHVEVAHRIGDRGDRRSLPAWFDEGVATFIGDNGGCTPDTPRAIDDLRRLSTQYVWTNFTNQPNRIHAAYCQAQNEVAAWSRKHGPKALVPIIDAVARGESFEQHYGSLAIAPEGQRKPELVGSFAFDEKAGDTTVDTSGHVPSASLLLGVARAAGHHGSGASVTNGGYVRASGFADLGLPDTPFSIALWVRPREGAKVLVHSAMLPSGGNDWCLPLLGHDGQGKLVAQVPFDSDPKAFLSAIGPKLALDAWSHVLMSWAADDGVRLYVNGKLAASRLPKVEAERRRDAPGSSVHLFFGGQAGGKCWPGALESGDYNGVLDDIRVFNYALTSEQVAAEAGR